MMAMMAQRHTHLPQGRRSHVLIERTDGGDLRVPVVESYHMLWPDEIQVMRMRRTKGLKAQWKIGIPQWHSKGADPSKIQWASASELRRLAQVARAATADGDDHEIDLMHYELLKAQDGQYGVWFNGPAAFMFHSMTPQTLDELANILDEQDKTD